MNTSFETESFFNTLLDRKFEPFANFYESNYVGNSFGFPSHLRRRHVEIHREEIDSHLIIIFNEKRDRFKRVLTGSNVLRVQMCFNDFEFVRLEFW